MNSKNEALNNNLLKYWFSNDLIKKKVSSLISQLYTPKILFVIKHMHLQELMVPISSDKKYL